MKPIFIGSACFALFLLEQRKAIWESEKKLGISYRLSAQKFNLDHSRRMQEKKQ